MAQRNSSNHSAIRNLLSSHPILANIVIIILVAVLGLCIVYFSIAIFTRHGQSRTLPGVENMSYTQAIELLHSKGFRVDIRDSLFRDDIKPGFVIEQFPKANSIVKPGCKVFLYINAVHPKEVVVDPDNHPAEDALRSYSFRQGLARLEELGFKNIRIVRVLGDHDRIVKVTANGRTVKKTQKVPVNAAIVVEVCDGRLEAVRESLQIEEYRQYVDEYDYAADSIDDYVNPVPVSDDEETGEEEEVTFIQ